MKDKNKNLKKVNIENLKCKILKLIAIRFIVNVLQMNLYTNASINKQNNVLISKQTNKQTRK